jgi:spore coat polysaccharide biosynthesis predicted glycosyltransferase SpsG
VNKKNIIFRFDFKRQKNLSYGHLFRANKIISYLKNNFNIFYLIKTEIQDNEYNYLRKKNLKQCKNNLFLNGKEFKKKIDFLIIDLPYKDNHIHLIKSKVSKIIVIEDHFMNYDLANFYFTNLKLNKTQLNKINLNKNFIYHGNQYFINNQRQINKKPKKIIKKIFVNFGGSDPLNLSSKFLKSINNEVFSKYIFYLVLGPGAKKLSKLKINKNINIYTKLSKKKFNLLRKDSDIAVVSGGNILIENIFLGLPSLAYPSSKYENLIINQLLKNNVVSKLNSFNNNILSQMIDLFNYKPRMKIFNESKKLIKRNKFHQKFKFILNF